MDTGPVGWIILTWRVPSKPSGEGCRRGSSWSVVGVPPSTGVVVPHVLPLVDSRPREETLPVRSGLYMLFILLSDQLKDNLIFVILSFFLVLLVL